MHAGDKKRHHIYDTVIQELPLTLGLLVGFLSLWLRRERALEDPQQSWPSESSSGPCEINDTYTTDNNSDHRNHHQGPVKSMIHIQLTTILTIGIIIRVLWNQQLYTQLTTILTIGVIIRALWNQQLYTQLTTILTIGVIIRALSNKIKNMTSNNADHPSHHRGPVKSTIHIQLTTMLTVEVIIRALSNNKTHTTDNSHYHQGQQPHLL